MYVLLLSVRYHIPFLNLFFEWSDKNLSPNIWAYSWTWWTSLSSHMNNNLYFRNVLFIAENSVGVQAISPQVLTTQCASGNILTEDFLSLLPELPSWYLPVQRSVHITPGAKLGLFAIWLCKYLIKSLRGGWLEIHLLLLRHTRHRELTTEEGPLYFQGLEKRAKDMQLIYILSRPTLRGTEQQLKVDSINPPLNEVNS